MRTTLTLDDDLVRELRARAARTGESFKSLINASLRRGLGTGDKPRNGSGRFRVRPKACGFRSGIDVLKLNQLNDELELSHSQRRIVRRRDRR